MATTASDSRGGGGHQAEDVAVRVEGMPPPSADLVELLADTTASRLDARSRSSQVRHPQIDMRRHNRLPGRDPLKRQPRTGTVAEHDVRPLIHRDRLLRQLAIKPAESIGIVTAQSDVCEIHPPIMSREASARNRAEEH